MEQQIPPPPYLVYLYGPMFCKTSNPITGYRHFSGTYLNPSELRKAIKMAMLVDLYDSGIIDFEMRTRKGFLRKRKELFVKLVKETKPSDFEFEKGFFTGLFHGKKEARLHLHRRKFIGANYDSILMKAIAAALNQELNRKGYLDYDGGRNYLPKMEGIKPLEAAAAEVKRKISEFEATKPDLFKQILRTI